MINNLNDLEKIVNKYLIKALEMTRDEIFNVISKKVFEYYYEDVFTTPPTDEPDYYIRTGRLMEELTASHIIQNGNGYEFTVGWPDDYLIFRYPGGFGNTYNQATGRQVLEWFNSRLHGGNVLGSHSYWDEAISELGGHSGIINKFKENCKKAGIPIKD